jgi:homoserine O-acetyltransferase
MTASRLISRSVESHCFCTIVGWFLVQVFFAATPIAYAQPGLNDGKQEFANLGRCTLQSGSAIENCQIGYRTFGHLNAARDNAILMPTWLYGNTGDLVNLFGDGSAPLHLVDTNLFFGIAIDAFGDGVSSSPSNSPTQHGPSFPSFTTADMVEAEYRVLIEVLRLKHLHAVLGLSMGGEQTFVWSVAHPDFFDLAVPVLGTPRLTSYDLQVKEIMLRTILSDPDYNDGSYTQQPPLRIANLFGNLTVTSPEFRNSRTTRDQFEAFIRTAEAPQPIDANDRVWQLRAVVHHDVIGHRTLADAARATPVHFLIIVNTEDHLVNPQPALDWAAATHAPIYISHASCAHLIMSCDAVAVSSRVRQFLATAGCNNGLRTIPGVFDATILPADIHDHDLVRSRERQTGGAVLSHRWPRVHSIVSRA